MILQPSIFLPQARAVVSSSARRAVSSFRARRNQRLREVYAPFTELERGSPEYHELANSGRVWESSFQPGNSEKLGYRRLQTELSGTLREIDDLKESMKLPVSELAKTLVREYAYQSVQIENNRLKVGDSAIIYDYLADHFFDSVPKMSSKDIAGADIPDVASLVPDAEPSQVAELRNHIAASQWIAEIASQNIGTPGLNEEDVHNLSALTIKDTESELLYTHGWGKRPRFGGYRATPIAVKSNPLRVFPYHVEVPSLMKRFFAWRNTMHEMKSLHPIIAACQLTAYFVHIHPFPDGNGRVSRMLMHDYLVRQGYLPIVMLNLEREDYIRMMDQATEGKPEEFVYEVANTQLDAMRTFHFREM